MPAGGPAIAAALAPLLAAGCARPEARVLAVLHAGSLSAPFQELEERFEEAHEAVDVRREPAGSADAIRKVADLGEKADVVASSDWALIESLMMDRAPPLADWYVQFASNGLVIAYTDRSTASDEVSADNWFDVFRREDVSFGFSNPNADPCGYRALMMIQLSEAHYGRPDLFEDLVQARSAITVTQEGTGSLIRVPEDLRPDPSIMVRPKEVDLVAQLQAGDLDYLVIYGSVARQHAAEGVRLLALPAAVDLSDPALASGYGTVSVQQVSDRPGATYPVKASPIVYGATIPTNAPDPSLAEEFLALLVGPEGQAVLRDGGLQPVVPARASDARRLPPSLRRLAAR